MVDHFFLLDKSGLEMSPEMQGMCIGVQSADRCSASLDFSLSKQLECVFFVNIFVFFSFVEVYRGTLETPTDRQHGSLKMSTCMIPSFKSLKHLWIYLEETVPGRQVEMWNNNGTVPKS